MRDALSGATVINCAAYTDVDGAEADPEAARAINARARATWPRRPRAWCTCRPTTSSTATKPGAYVESDPVNPVSEYGRSKLAGERATLTASPHSLIVRTSWLFGAGGRNFVDTMLRAGEDGERAEGRGRPGGLPDVHRTPRRGARARWRRATTHGFLHVAGSGACSWFEFARAIFERAGMDVDVRPCTTAEFPRPARRPANSVLASERGAPKLPAWQEGLDAYLGVRA